MPNIIKASQYDDIMGSKLVTAKPVELTARPSELLGSAPKINLKEQHQQIMNDALQKAKNIVEAAQNYSLNQLKESTMRMNEECAQMKLRSYEDGYRLGHEEGYTEGHEQGHQEGYDLGHDEGYAQGARQAKAEVQQTLSELRQMIETVQKKEEELLAQYQEDLVGLSVAIAQKVIRAELSLDEKAMQSIIQNVVESYRDLAWIKIQVSSSTAKLLLKSDRSMGEALQQVSNNVKIIENPEMDDGDCIIDLPDRRIDAGVGSQMGQIRSALGM